MVPLFMATVKSSSGIPCEVRVQFVKGQRAKTSLTNFAWVDKILHLPHAMTDPFLRYRLRGPPAFGPGLFFEKNMSTVFLIDGFNFYYSIKKLDKKIKWFDYYKLCACYLTKNQTIYGIYYFSALAEWLPESSTRHRIFIEAQKKQ